MSRHREAVEVADDPTYMYAPAPYVRPSAPLAPWAPPQVAPLEAMPFPEAALDQVRLSVWQAADGPTVSVITVPDGEVITKTFPSWPAAGRYVDKVKKGYEAKGVKVIFIEEAV